MIVRRKKRAAADAIVQVLDDGPRQRDAVVGARAAADLVENDEAAGSGRVENAGADPLIVMWLLCGTGRSARQFDSQTIVSSQVTEHSAAYQCI